MFRLVIDPGVLIAALISAKGAPRQLILSWLDGEFELLVSNRLIAELERVLEREKFRTYVSLRDAMRYVTLFRRFATFARDVEPPPQRSSDPGDDYLLALAASQTANYLVSGDPHLTKLKNPVVPIATPRMMLDRLAQSR